MRKIKEYFHKIVLLNFKFFYVLACFLLLNACNQNLGKFPEMFVGKWTMDNPELRSYEIWEKISDTFFIGKSFTIDVETEEMAILKKGNDWYCIRQDANQTSNPPIPYKLIKQTTSNFIFENEKHGFPKQIEYKFTSAEQLMVSQYGNGKQYELYFNKEN